MSRVKRGVTSHKRHKALLSRAQGFRGGRKNLIRQAKQAVIHAGVDAYRGRKEKKQQMRSLWIVRISAALKPHEISYSQFIGKLKVKNIDLDRKVLSQIAIENPETFEAIVKQVI